VGVTQVSVPVHVGLAFVPQQGWPMAPQGRHMSSIAPLPFTHRVVAAVQVPRPVPLEGGQQTWLAPPHGLHMPGMLLVAPVQTPPAWQISPAQQGIPAAPHIWQVRVAPPPGLAQPRPAVQVLPAQQTWFAAPQGEQTPSAPVPPWQERLAPQVFAAPPPQQG
jgi:hypothetical protein